MYVYGYVNVYVYDSFLLSIETSGTLRGAIPGAQNLHFATISRDRPTESCERVHPAE